MAFRFTVGSALIDMQARALAGATTYFGAARAGAEAPILRRSTIPLMERVPTLMA